MVEMVNNIWLAWKLACMLKTCNPKVRFPKYEFNNKLLGDIKLLKVTIGVSAYTKVVLVQSTVQTAKVNWNN